jgi:DNA-directed RNA polymerase specialized sigma24 family protein
MSNLKRHDPIVARQCASLRPIGTPLAVSLAMKNTNLSRIEKLVKLYYPSLFHFAERLCGSLTVAMELTQRTFREAFDHGNFLPVPRNSRAWLFAILFSRFLNDRLHGHEPCDELEIQP